MNKNYYSLCIYFYIIMLCFYVLCVYGRKIYCVCVEDDEFASVRENKFKQKKKKIWCDVISGFCWVYVTCGRLLFCLFFDDSSFHNEKFACAIRRHTEWFPTIWTILIDHGIQQCRRVMVMAAFEEKIDQFRLSKCIIHVVKWMIFQSVIVWNKIQQRQKPLESIRISSLFWRFWDSC